PANDVPQGVFAFWAEQTGTYTADVLGQHVNPAPPADVGPTAGRRLGAHPNPARSSTSILLRLSQQSMVSIHVVDVTGRLVRELMPRSLRPAGDAPAAWDLRD